MVQWSQFGEKELSDQMVILGRPLNRGVNLCDKWDMSMVACRKEKPVRSVFLHSYLWLQYFNWLSPSGLSLVWCCAAVFRDNGFLAVFTICDCSVARASWEPVIVDVPSQCRQPLHDFPPFDLKSSLPFVKSVCNKRKAKAICKKTK